MKANLRRADQNLNLPAKIVRSGLSVLVGICLATTIVRAADQKSETSEVRILQMEGRVEIMPVGAKTWVLTQTNQVLRASDRLRTGNDSRVTLRWSDQSILSFAALTEIEILPPDKSDSLAGLSLFKGILSFFHRDKPGRIRTLTRGATASIEGTEFVMEVTQANAGERVILSVIDGVVELSNAQGTRVYTNDQQGVIEPGQAPSLPRGFIADNVLQWCFYYPGVLDLNDLSLTSEESQALKTSLDAYRAGDLVGALASYPASRQNISDSERIYHAALLLAVGQVPQTEDELTNLRPDVKTDRLAGALRTLIAAVKRNSRSPALGPRLATELLAESYYQQSLANDKESLKTALQFARYATIVSPEFGFAWERVAELEFCFGHISESKQALDRSIELSPSNAQAMTLKGFLLAANSRFTEAKGQFDRAIMTDSALGNAWLGRGLCRIRQGDTKGGQEDLLVAAASEPQRSLLRSYLGKAYAKTGDLQAARHELELAKSLDPKDPTPWLYSAVLNDQYNRFNEGISDLEKSQQLNDNRRLFRSRLLLDQDEAVRSSTLAELYQDAGMPDVAVREAARAVSYDYANYSAHLFLADSFNNLRDPTRFNLRYETPWFNELLLANLLSPVGGTPLSQNVSQQEYSRLFDQDKVGLASSTTYRSDGQIYELASQYGNVGNTAWALDLDYQHNDGVRPNNELDRLEWFSTFKQQLTPQDSVMLLTKYEDYHSGDNFQYYDPTEANPTFQFDEQQHPIALGGYHHEWSPGVHTLMLGGRLENEQQFSALGLKQLVLWETTGVGVDYVESQPFNVDLSTDLEIYTAEINQIARSEHTTLVFGALWQGGQFGGNSTLADPATNYLTNPTAISINEDFSHVKGYAYLTVEPISRVWLTAGVSYDQIQMPENYRYPPLSPGSETRSLLAPKAALVWSPIDLVTFRGIYCQSLGGVSLEESFRLEPAQLAGFSQVWRSVISESVVGSVSAPEYEIAGLALDLKPSRTTYAGLQVERIASSVHRTIGVFRVVDNTLPAIPSSTLQNLDYDELTFTASLNQLIGEGLVLGAQYRFAQAELKQSLAEYPNLDSDQRSDLHRVGGYALYNHPSGFFARFDATYYHQSNAGYTPAQPGDNLVQLDLAIGYRMANQRAKLSIGILNLTDADYHLDPLTLYSELPRERVFFARFSFRF